MFLEGNLCVELTADVSSHCGYTKLQTQALLTASYRALASSVTYLLLQPRNEIKSIWSHYHKPHNYDHMTQIQTIMGRVPKDFAFASYGFLSSLLSSFFLTSSLPVVAKGTLI